MKRTLLTLALIAGAVLVQPVVAQTGSSNGSGSGFLNNDLYVGRGGTPGPAELNLRLGGAGYLSPYRLGMPVGVGSVSGTIISQPAVIDGCGASVVAAPACGAVISQPAVVDACGGTVIPQGEARVISEQVIPMADSCGTVLSQPAVACPVCIPSDALIVPGVSAPTLIDI